MKKIFTILLLCFVAAANAQLLTTSPDFVQETSTPVVITMDATHGNQALQNYTPTTDVYVHIGVITNKSSSSADWKYVKVSNFNAPNALVQCTYAGNNKWTFTITGGLRSFFNITDASETIQKIAILFRSGNGNTVQRNTNSTDMYIPVYSNGLFARIDEPFRQPLYNPLPEAAIRNLGAALSITAKASETAAIKIYFNGTLLSSGSGTTLTANTVIATGGNQQIIAAASDGTTTVYDTSNFIVAPPNIAALPVGVTDGINYEAGDTSAILVLYAPGKKSVFVTGDFTNWAISVNYLMNITPDGNRFWKRITGLTPGTEYAYQYLIDGSLTVADYNTEKILDPDNDKYIPAATYPNLKAYPTGKTTGIVSILQTAKPVYNWQVTNFKRPDKRNLVIYELLVRDFTAAQNWQTLKDTLGYLKRLGINAIEVMPFNEFEGNNNWGYNPDFYFAPDKAYGTETALKQFIDECHKNGMAVIMDMVLNHSFGSSPMVQMYFDGANNRPAANNPWFNQTPTHPYNVGYQFNHESQATKDFTQRVMAHWLTHYNIDGYRFDLAKGFTQKNTCTTPGCSTDAEVNNWGAYDATRVAIWDTIYKQQQSISQGSYCILEMFADNSEETIYANNGIMLWGNLNASFNQATMGYSDGWNFNGGIYTIRGWNQPGLVTYQESHDEERLMWKNEQYGNSNGTYNVKDTATGLKRNAMATAFWAMIPGPKLMWQFGELGYDYSINTCSNGTVDNSCRTDAKPVKWDYYADARRKALYDVYAKLFALRNTPNYLSTFTTGAINSDFSGAVKWLTVSNDSLKVLVFGNFDVTAQTVTINFPSTGIWYSYLNDSLTSIANTAQSLTLQPGAYYVFTDRDVKTAVALPVNWRSFTAQKTGKQTAMLNWSTASELNNKYYDVQRSIDGSNYISIGSVAAGASPNMEQHYTFSDVQPFGGINYYRLRQVDKDGRSNYSAVVQLNFGESNALWQVYPNPAVSSATALYAKTDLTKFRLLLTDISGKVLYQSSLNTVKAGQQLKLPLGHLSSGIYLLKITADKGSSTEKLLIP